MIKSWYLNNEILEAFHSSSKDKASYYMYWCSELDHQDVLVKLV